LHYTYVAGGDCSRCADLALPPRLPPRVDAQALQAALAAPAACRGGAPGTGAFIAPLDGVWIHTGPSGVAEQLACQTAPLRDGTARTGACEGLQPEDNATAWRTGQTKPDQLAAICGEGYTGFLCGQCTDGFKKLAGECLQCLYFNWVALLQALALNSAVALFLLHKSMKPVVSRVELPLIWNKVSLLLTSVHSVS
jgi:hypothetical protein